VLPLPVRRRLAQLVGRRLRGLQLRLDLIACAVCIGARFHIRGDNGRLCRLRGRGHARLSRLRDSRTACPLAFGRLLLHLCQLLLCRLALCLRLIRPLRRVRRPALGECNLLLRVLLQRLHLLLVFPRLHLRRRVVLRLFTLRQLLRLARGLSSCLLDQRIPLLSSLNLPLPLTLLLARPLLLSLGKHRYQPSCLRLLSLQLELERLHTLL